MKDFNYLNKQYLNDAKFNRMVNVFTTLISENQCLPGEIRDALFFAQYKYEVDNVRHVINTEADFQKLQQAKILMQDLFNKNNIED